MIARINGRPSKYKMAIRQASATHEVKYDLYKDKKIRLPCKNEKLAHKPTVLKLQ